MTIHLPDALAERLKKILPEDEREKFISNAIAEALAAREADARLADILLSEIDPELEPEREAAECIAAVEEGLAAIEAGEHLITLEEAQRRWAEDSARRRAALSAEETLKRMEAFDEPRDRFAASVRRSQP